MVSKIDNYNVNTPRRIDSAKVGSTGVTSESANNTAVKTSASTHSESLLSRGIALAKQAPEIDQSRVDALKQAISRGEFQVDARAIANALLAMDAD